MKSKTNYRPSKCNDCLFWFDCEDEFDLSPNNKPCKEFIYWLDDKTPKDQAYLKKRPPWEEKGKPCPFYYEGMQTWSIERKD